MNSVGIDVSKGKSMIAVMRPFGEVVVSPFEIHHTDSELCELTKLLSALPGETRVVMESTGNYHLPVSNSPIHPKIWIILQPTAGCIYLSGGNLPYIPQAKLQSINRQISALLPSRGRRLYALFKTTELF